MSNKKTPRTAIFQFMEKIPEMVKEFEETAENPEIETYKKTETKNENAINSNSKEYDVISKTLTPSLLFELPSGKKISFFPKKVDPSKCVVWTGNLRKTEFLNDQSTQELKEKIKAQGQLVPALARPLLSNSKFTHEIIYGSRRHYVCQNLGLPLLILEAEINDIDALLFMDAENSGRKDPSVFELAFAYKHWLDKGIFHSQGHLAEKLGLSRMQVNKIISLIHLPEKILKAFYSPQDLKLKWAIEILKLCNSNVNNKNKILNNADLLTGKNLSPKKIYEELVNIKKTNVKTAPNDIVFSTSKLLMSSSGKKICKITKIQNGGIRITLDSNLSKKESEQIIGKIEEIVKNLL